MFRRRRAQDEFQVLLKEQLAPAMRALGLKGSGQRYEISSPRDWVVVGIQKSMYSDSEEIRFTLNLTVVSKDAWGELRKDVSGLPERPAANTSYGSGVWQKRIGFLMPAGDDFWWRFTGKRDTGQVVREVVAAVRDSALPAMRERMQA